jgi:arginase
MSPSGGRMNLFFPLCVDGGHGRELYEGARGLRDYLSRSMDFEDLDIERVREPAPDRGIFGYAAIVSGLARARSLLSSRAPERLFTIGGGCGIEVPLVDYFLGRHPDLKLLWFDAHGDLNSPASSPSGHFHGMPLRFLLEPGLDEGIRASGSALDPASLRYLGVRSLDEPERSYIESRGISVLEAGDARGAVAGWKGSPLYVHIDLDVLDPGDYPNVKCPEPGGLRLIELAEILRTIADECDLVGLSVLENTTTDVSRIALLEDVFEVAHSL